MSAGTGTAGLVPKAPPPIAPEELCLLRRAVIEAIWTYSAPYCTGAASVQVCVVDPSTVVISANVPRGYYYQGWLNVHATVDRACLRDPDKVATDIVGTAKNHIDEEHGL